MSEVSALERRYRWLIAAYPPGHRRIHGDEMMGVLLASARPSQRWPRLADAADLMLGALLIRVRALPRQAPDPAWRDALALLSLIVPILMLADGLATTDLLGIAIRTVAGHPATPFWLAYPWVWPVIFGPALMTLLALLGLRRSTALAALAVTVTSVVPDVMTSASYLASGHTALRIFLGPLAAVGALLSPGPRRAREILRWPGVAAIGAGAIGLAELSKGPEFDIPLMRWPTPWLVIAAVLALTAGACMLSRTGRRLLMILAMPGVAYASYLGRALEPGWSRDLPGVTVLLLPTGLAIGEIVALVAARRRRRPMPPPGADPAG